MYNKHVISIIMYYTLFTTCLFSTFLKKKTLKNPHFILGDNNNV